MNKYLNKPFVLLIGYLFYPFLVAGQEIDLIKSPAASETSDTTTFPPLELKERSITATRTKKSLFDVPNSTNQLSADSIHHKRMSRTLPEVLAPGLGIMVQKTSHGQGSPYIRGFTGQQTLFRMDGVRLNNSVWRDGPNQYSNTIDLLVVEKMEVIKGPGSVLYGSGAVGGTVNVSSMEDINSVEGIEWNRKLFYRYSGAEQSNSGRVQLGLNYKGRLQASGGFSPKLYGNLRAGGTTNELPKTGYNQYDGDFKLKFKLNNHHQLTAAYQAVQQDEAWRTHKTIYAVPWNDTHVGNEQKRSLDQKRYLSFIQYKGTDLNGLVDNSKLTLSYQLQKEDQLRTKSSGEYDKQGFSVGTLGTELQLNSKPKLGTLTYGLEYYHDRVDSYKRNYNADSNLKNVEIQGPVGDDAGYYDFGLFLQYDVWLAGLVDVIPGLRYSYFSADAQKVKDPVGGNRIRVYDEWHNIVGSFRFISHVSKKDKLKLYGGLAQGFRAPNLSDLTRFDNARSHEYEIPVPHLKPENYVTSELGIRTDLGIFYGEAAYYYTWLDNLIIRTPTGNYVQIDSLTREYEITKKNSGNGYVNGVETKAGLRFLNQFFFETSLYWMYGELSSYPNSEAILKREPLTRLMPLTGYAEILWQRTGSPWWLKGAVTAAAKQDKLSTSDKSDTQRIPPGGTPGYVVYDISAGWRQRNAIRLSLGIQNITDADYRIHGSGVNQPGRNVIAVAELDY